LNILLGTFTSGNDVEIHLSPDYLDSLSENPWFFPLRDVPCSKMSVLSLRLFLSNQGKHRTYKIGIDKLKTNLHIRGSSRSRVVKQIKSACEQISWATMTYEDKMCSFEIERRGAVPIYSLRRILDDSLEQAK